MPMHTCTCISKDRKAQQRSPVYFKVQAGSKQKDRHCEMQFQISGLWRAVIVHLLLSLCNKSHAKTEQKTHNLLPKFHQNAPQNHSKSTQKWSPGGHLGHFGPNLCSRGFPKVIFLHIWGHFRHPWAPLGIHLAPLWSTLGAQGSHFGALWAPCGTIWVTLGN